MGKVICRVKNGMQSIKEYWSLYLLGLLFLVLITASIHETYQRWNIISERWNIFNTMVNYHVNKIFNLVIAILISSAPFIWITWLVKYIMKTWRKTMLEIHKIRVD